jgi:hypothetical protein
MNEEEAAAELERFAKMTKEEQLAELKKDSEALATEIKNPKQN